MKIHTLQLIDRYLGIPLSALLSLGPGKKRPPDSGGMKNILVIKMLGMGSIILMSPMVRSLRKRFPEARVDFLTMDNHGPICRMYKLADRVFTVDFGGPGRFIFSNLKTIRELRSVKYDLIIDAEFYSRYTALVSRLCGGASVAAFYSRNVYRGKLSRVRVYFNQYRHMIDNFLELAMNVDAPITDRRLSRPAISDSLRSGTEDLLRLSGLNPDRPYVLFNPHVSSTSSHIDRSWPLEYFRQVGAYLHRRGYQAVVIDAPGKSDYVDQLVEMSEGTVKRLIREVSLEGLSALIERAFLLITNDSGPLHMAVSLGTPTFSFFGTETPVLYGHDFFPHTIFYEGLACSPCLSVLNFKRGRCERGVECIRRISPEKVIKAFAGRETELKDYRDGKR